MTDDRTTDTRTVADSLVAALGQAGYARSGKTICAALGLDPDKPATATTQLEPGQHVVEARWPGMDWIGHPTWLAWTDGKHGADLGGAWVIVRSGGAG